MRQLVLIAHNLRSTHNVGSLLRTAEGLGVEHVYLTGYTPYPILANDERLPHLAAKMEKDIHKTALGAERTQSWSRHEDVTTVIRWLKSDKYEVSAVEQSDEATQLPEFIPGPKVALLVGREVEGVEPEVLTQCQRILEIPMFGAKESFNVVQAAAMTLYHCRFYR